MSTNTYLSCSSCHSQVTTVFTKMNLLNSKPWVITVGVKAAHLKQKQVIKVLSCLNSKKYFRYCSLKCKKKCHKKQPNLAKRWPLALSALVHVVIGVSIRLENHRCA